jgi:hypothetical protein
MHRLPLPFHVAGAVSLKLDGQNAWSGKLPPYRNIDVLSILPPPGGVFIHNYTKFLKYGTMMVIGFNGNNIDTSWQRKNRGIQLKVMCTTTTRTATRATTSRMKIGPRAKVVTASVKNARTAIPTSISGYVAKGTWKKRPSN